MSQLKFLSIDIDNFKTFTGEHTFKLAQSPGLYYITGKNLVAPELGANGVGKSTIFDALTWVLWGKTGRDNKPAAAITPWGSKKTTSVELHLMRNGDLLHIKRQRNPNKLVVMNKDDLDGHEVTDRDIPQILGMSEAIFRRTLVLGQFGELFLDLKPEAQAQMFTEALGLDIWLKAVTVASDASKAATRKKIQADADLAANVRLLAETATEIEEAEKRSVEFEANKKARVALVKAQVGIRAGALKELEDEPVLAPKLPDRSKSNGLARQLNDIHAPLEIGIAEVKRLEGDLTAAEAKFALFQNAKKKTCPECGQAISAEDFAEKKEAARLAVVQLLKKIEDKLDANKVLRDSGLSLKADYDAAVKEESQAVTRHEVANRKYNDHTADLRTAKSMLEQDQRTLTTEQAAENAAEQSLARLRTRRQTYRAEQGDLKEKAIQAASESEQADYWVEGFREIRLSIIDRALIELEMAASRHASMLGLDDWGIKFDTERETQTGKVSYGFSVFLYPPGQSEPVKWESYSGGESQRWQLACAFALSEVLLARAGLSPNIEVLDEPTRGLSADGVADLLDHLRDRALELGRSIYFVDHHSLDKGAFDGTLTVIKDKKGSSFKWA